MAAAALLIAIVTIRVSRHELAGVAPEPQEPAPQPAALRLATVQVDGDQAALAAAVRPGRQITGIGWQPLTWVASSFGRIRLSSQLPGPSVPGAICLKEDQQ